MFLREKNTSEKQDTKSTISLETPGLKDDRTGKDQCLETAS